MKEEPGEESKEENLYNRELLSTLVEATIVGGFYSSQMK
jgi:hypothetical protein